MPRPKSFDPDTVLAKAMGVFWEKGYDAASISDLTAAMGINRFSLYDTFGDKHELYLKALDSYIQKIAQPIIERIDSVTTLDELAGFFDGLIAYQHSEEHKPCCMMQKAAISMAGCDQAARERVELSRTTLHAAYAQALTRIRENGALAENLDIDDAARLILVVQTGLSSFTESPLPKAQAKALIAMMLESFRKN